MHRRALPLLITAVLAAAATSCRGPADSTETRVALLGTGTPNPDQEDIRYRLYGGEPSNDRGWRVNVHEIQEGEIYSDERVKVEAFLVQHGTWPNAYGFRFTSPDRVIVISGDTRPCENVEKFASAADLLIHEAYCVRTYGRRPENWKAYHATHHTSTVELGELAARAKPKRVVIYHVLAWGASDEEMVREVKSKFSGQVAVGRDLQIY